MDSTKSKAKPRVEVELNSGEKLVVWAKFKFNDADYKIRHEIVCREHGHIHVEEFRPNFG